MEVHLDEKQLQSYVKSLRKEYLQGDSTELTYRSFLKTFIESSVGEVDISEEKKKLKGIGRPDFTSFIRKIKNGYIETKDIDIDLDKELEGEQIRRYINGAIPNLILTDYLRFILVRNVNGKAEVVLDVSLLDSKALKSNIYFDDSSVKLFQNLLSTFFNYSLPTIKEPAELARELARRTGLLRDLAKEQLELDIEEQQNGVAVSDSIYEFYIGFRELVKDADINMCANAYAETIAYGLFLSTIETKEKINRKNAANFIPPTIKIIKKIFMNIAGDDLPDNISWIVDEIIDVLNASDLQKIILNFDFGGRTYRDPFTHFYEDFLQVYDPERRRQLGVYYTPDPVVSFITRSINYTLQKTFGITQGLASSRVNLLDPCTGTGTFLSRAYLLALDEARETMKGAEKSLVAEHLLKNFLGFEISISPYVISHLKLSLLLNKENYVLGKDERAQVYLTNTLDISEASELGAFMGVLSAEVKKANDIKINSSIMVVMGNPPYFKRSSNKSAWILELTADYKKDLRERRQGNLDDDYVKFIRFGQWKIESNRNGVLGFITNNSFINNTTFRIMRKSLLESFNHLYILNLHGDSNLHERAPDGGNDENVFDIQQGVAVSIFVKIDGSAEHRVFYADVWGERKRKFAFLDSNEIDSIPWQEVSSEAPYFLFEPSSVEGGAKYERYFPINKIFKYSIGGLETKNDDFVVNISREKIQEVMKKFLNSKITDEEIKLQLHVDDIIIKDNKGRNRYEFKVMDARAVLRKEGLQDSYYRRYQYRPFDERWIYLSSEVISRTRQPLSDIVSDKDLSICVSRMTKAKEFSSVLISKGLVDWKYCEYSRGCYFFPLYGKKEENEKLIPVPKSKGRPINFSDDFVNYIDKLYGEMPEPEEIFYYIYAVLYSRPYREKYRDYLRIDFPKIPFIKNIGKFKQISKFGRKLAQLHLLEQVPMNKSIKFSGSGSNNRIEVIEYKDKKVWINKEKYFEGIGQDVWEFVIGGYPVLSKWLKSRKAMEIPLTYSEIEHWIRVASAIAATLEIMDDLENVTRRTV